MKGAFEKNKTIGDLVWIPANTALMFYNPEIQAEWSWRCVEKKEPVCGLIISDQNGTLKVLVGKEEFFVRKKEVYGV